MAANLKLSHAEFLVMQIFFVESKDCVCIVLWGGSVPDLPVRALSNSVCVCL